MPAVVAVQVACEVAVEVVEVKLTDCGFMLHVMPVRVRFRTCYVETGKGTPFGA